MKTLTPPTIQVKWNFVRRGKKLFPVLISGLLLFSCSDFESTPDNQIALEAQAKKSGLDPNDPGLTFAAALSQGLKNESLRKFVSQNIQDQFDGDLNFLYFTTKSQSLGGPNSKSVTFEEALFGSQSNFRSQESNLEFDPLMQVALRGNDEQLIDFDEIDGDIPILYISPSQDLEDNPFVPMILSDGNVSEWDIRNIPDQPVLVVSQNERLVKVPKNPSARIATYDACIQSATPYFSDGTNDFYFYTDYFCGGGGLIGNPPVGGGGGTTGCDRDLNNKSDHVNQVRFATFEELLRAERWQDGEPEVYFIVFTGSSNANLQQIRKNVPIVARNRWKNCSIFQCHAAWVETDIELFHWEKSNYGEIFTIRWFEFDGGGTRTVTTGMSTPNGLGGTNNFQFSSTINLNDVDLGTAVVEYCSKAALNDFKIHSSSSILFGLRLDD
ncbi:hypothetical protein [Cognataquiflexum aquatile]|uniref:hypothetical protein n=1 Tax=Cognataquiflexum aquatile TaxID=2249427 RepID=UPI000DE91716|nr:hypothetical protein [Cognataquiflexum aquatile]